MADSPDKPPERPRRPRRQPGSEDAMPFEGDELVGEQAPEPGEQPELDRPSPPPAHEPKRAAAGEERGTHRKEKDKAVHEEKAEQKEGGTRPASLAERMRFGRRSHRPRR